MSRENKSRPVYIRAARVTGSTAKAFRIVDPDGLEAWIPRSQVVESDVPVDEIGPGNEDFEFAIPEWLADERGFEGGDIPF